MFSEVGNSRLQIRLLRIDEVIPHLRKMLQKTMPGQLDILEPPSSANDTFTDV